METVKKYIKTNNIWPDLQPYTLFIYSISGTSHSMFTIMYLYLMSLWLHQSTPGHRRNPRTTELRWLSLIFTYTHDIIKLILIYPIKGMGIRQMEKWQSWLSLMLLVFACSQFAHTDHVKCTAQFIPPSFLCCRFELNVTVFSCRWEMWRQVECQDIQTPLPYIITHTDYHNLDKYKHAHKYITISIYSTSVCLLITICTLEENSLPQIR